MCKKESKRRVMLIVMTMFFVCSIILPINVVDAAPNLQFTKMMVDSKPISLILENNNEILKLPEKLIEELPDNLSELINKVKIKKFLIELPIYVGQELKIDTIEPYLNHISGSIVKILGIPEVDNFIDTTLDDLGKVLDTKEVRQTVEDILDGVLKLMETPGIKEYIENIPQDVTEEQLKEYMDKISEETKKIQETPEFIEFREKITENFEKVVQTGEATKFMENIQVNGKKLLDNPELMNYFELIMADIGQIMQTPEMVTYMEEMTNGMEDLVIMPDSSENNPEIQDILERSSIWAREGLEEAINNSLIPEDMMQDDLTENITREEFVNIAITLYEVMTGEELKLPAVNPFIDTNDEQVQKAFELGIVSGTSKNTFSPESTITREEMATIITNLLSKVGVDVSVDMNEVVKFEDDDEISDWAKASVYFMSNNGIIKGVSSTENVFDAKSQATKEQSVLVSNLILNTFLN